MMTTFGATSIVVGTGFWVATIRWHFSESGSLGFDMTTASAFDLKWSKGAWFLGVGAGMLGHSLPLGIVVGVGGFLSSMLVKPLLVRIVATRVSKLPATHADDRPPSGFAALKQAERDAVARRSSSLDRDA